MDFDPRQQRQQLQGVRSGTTPGEQTPASIGQTGQWFTETKYGGPVRVQSDPVTFTTTVTQVIPQNPRRVFWLLVNRGTVNAACDVDPSMTFADGILMGAGGGFVSSDLEEDGQTTGDPVFGACESGTCTVRRVQVIRV